LSRVDLAFMFDWETSDRHVQYNYCADVTRHTVSPRSSAISKPPAASTARPTGRPLASSFAFRKPVTTSCGNPLGLPSLNGTKITRYPLKGLRSQLKRYRAVPGVDDLIDVISCGEDVEKGKPSPGLVRLAAQRLGIGPGRAVMTGDTPYDARAARAAGVSALGVLREDFPKRR
jgi:hypothetical protein